MEFTSTSDPQRLDGAAQQLVKRGRRRYTRSLPDLERRVQWAMALGFVAAAAGLLLAFPPEDWPSLPLALALVAAYGALSRIQYELGPGFTVPTQLVVVPMLFLVAPSLVPAMAAAGYVLTRLPEYVSGRSNRQRIVFNLADSWYVVGPALVFCVAGVGAPDWSDWPVYLLALGAQFAFDVGPAAVWMATVDDSPVRPQLKVFALVWAVDALLAPMGLLVAFASAEHPYAFLLVLPFAALFSLFTRERNAHIEKVHELNRAYRGTARVLAEVLEDTNEYTGSHSRDVVSLTREVCEAMGLDEHTSQEVELTALLHDVGKIAIPPQILDKPGRLSEEEWAVMKTHVVEGQRMLDQVGGALRPVARAVRASHERFDGNGYPDGLLGEEIPLAARVVSCCDALHAMTSDRPYRSAMRLEDAVAELRHHAGTQFDPEIVEGLVAVATRPRPVQAGPEAEAVEPATTDAAGGHPPSGAKEERARRSFQYPSLHGELEAHAEHIAAVAQATRELAQANDGEAVRRAICKAALRVSGATAAVLVEPVGEGWLGETGRAGKGSSAPGNVALEGTTLEHPRFIPELREGDAAAQILLGAVGGRSAHLEPVRRDAELMAAVALVWDDQLDRLPAPVAAMMTLLAAEAAVALERAGLLARLEAAARTDELTGVLNRNAWTEELVRELARAQRDGRPLCVVMLDIDHFKRFNDQQGHLAGDEVLTESARAWRAELRVTDQLGRYGGDEFLALLPGCTVADGQRLVERLSGATAAGQTCSAGIAVSTGGETPENVIRRADEALLIAKQRGRNQIALAA